ncbi:glycosyltransferase [Sphingobacterium sp. BN32]|uniref:glycosyltransferase n=1 Tax=Sphingobacterium sp. BN32 TaxID=3058432 RepID=UPI00265D2C54|nr:glycosyltransferase [Sphingobacterium sp. BN32]WKK58408.1 glycosyltransferase [Sphingobacterium sp. BN32]
MKVAYCIRKDYQTRGGGDVVQMLMTKKYLEKIKPDIQINIVSEPSDLTNDYDLCHIFNFSTFSETSLFFEKAQLHKIKIASSPIYWDYNITAYQYFSRLNFFKISENILNIEIFILKLLQKFYPISKLTSPKFSRLCKNFLENSDVVLPNSIEEYDLLLKFVKEKDRNTYNYQIVFNATEIGGVKLSSTFSQKYNLPENFLLQVGRIEPIKNQLSVLKALLYDNTIPIVFLGKVFVPEYYEELKKMAEKRGNVFFVQEVPYEDVFDFYANAHSHILPSLRESPGLVSLEAYSQNCNIICSEYPFSPYNTYFSKIAISINPLDLQSIRTAVMNSFAHTKKTNNMEILKTFSWENTAKTTLEAYNSIL